MMLPLTLIGCACLMANEAAKAERDLPANLRVVLESTKPLRSPRGGRLALYVLPITGSLAGLEDARAEAVLRELDDRGIGYTVDWSPGATRPRSPRDCASAPCSSGSDWMSR